MINLTQLTLKGIRVANISYALKKRMLLVYQTSNKQPAQHTVAERSLYQTKKLARFRNEARQNYSSVTREWFCCEMVFKGVSYNYVDSFLEGYIER